MGKKRSAGINILLFIVTLGAYWFVWLYLAFTEVAKDKGKPFRAGPWIIGLAALHVVYFGIVIARFVEQLGKPPAAGTNLFTAMMQDALSPMALAVAGVSIAFYVVQLLYTRQAHALVAESLAGVGMAAAPSAALPIVFNALLIAGAVPFLGIVGLAGWIVAIVWIVQIQAAMNQYWDLRMGAQNLPPMGVPTMASHASRPPGAR